MCSLLGEHLLNWLQSRELADGKLSEPMAAFSCKIATLKKKKKSKEELEAYCQK